MILGEIPLNIKDLSVNLLSIKVLDPIAARGSLRITLGRFNKANEIEEFMNILPKMLQPRSPMRKRI